MEPLGSWLHFVLYGQAPLQMRFGPRQPGTEFALLFWLGTAHRAANEKCEFPQDFHDFILQDVVGGKLVNCEQRARISVRIFRRP